MDAVLHVPALGRVLLVFAGILLLVRLRVPLSAALLLGGSVLHGWSPAGWAALPGTLRDGIGSRDLWLLVLSVGLVIEFGRFLASERSAEVLMGAARRWGGRHGRALTLMALPAALGLVPMPGGALFSAPLVGRAVEEPGWRGEWKAAVNYWFRHVWEYWWPLYPVVIVTLSIFEMPTWQYMAAQAPFTLAAFGIGYLVLIRPHLGALAAADCAGSAGDGRGLFRLMAPLLVVVAGAMLLPPLMGRAWPGVGLQTRKLLGMIAGLVAGTVMMGAQEPGRIGLVLAGLRSRKTVGVLVMLVGVMLFKHLMEASGLLPLAGADLAGRGSSMLLVVALLPFVAGLVTGLASGFAGCAFPLVAGLLSANPGGWPLTATVVLAFAFGYAGMMLSPLHLCLILTGEHFATNYRTVLRLILPCVGGMLLCACLFVALLRAAGW